VFLAILWSNNNELGPEQWTEWISFYLFYKVFIGIIIGSAIGFLYSYFTQKLSKDNEKKIHQAFVALSLTLIAYGLAEILSSYGFLSVFFADLFAHYHQQNSGESSFSDPSLKFITNVKKFLIIFWIIFFGGSVIAGILKFNTISTILFSLLLVGIIRPLLGMLALYKTDLPYKKKLAISFFGIRGIGSVFYLTYAIKHGNFDNLNHIYAIVALIIFISVIVHGLSVKRMILKLDAK